ncbi:zinc finger CCCH domain-containing protein 7B-like [Patella vulgata]|uniref:zinc finger CCCH domain-containing protein 7B-like n=1 Tax=Patella vulgata TaxID=6465 RepID=UPI0024A91341|nr:zinc finger CCCH domain-containing protein 7B-like [Patella vulgata]
MSEQHQQLQLLSDNEETEDIDKDNGELEFEYCSHKKERKKKKAKGGTTEATDAKIPSNLNKFQAMSCPNLAICGTDGSSAGIIRGTPHGNETHNTFQLKDTTVDSCEFRLVCEKCFTFTGIPGMYTYNEIDGHSCLFNKLAAKHKRGTLWFQIRKRFNHSNSIKSYGLCKSIFQCKGGEKRCSFAHNVFEQYFWNLEKNSKFHISKFILRLNLERLLNEFRGTFILMCQKCYEGNPPKTNLENIHGFCQQKHCWEENKILVHSNHSKITLIDNKPNLPRHAAFRICKYLKHCNDRKKNNCVYAHSEIENEIWNVEHHCQVTREEIVRVCHMITNELPTNEIPEHATRSSDTNFKGQTLQRPKSLLNTDNHESNRFKPCPYKITRLCKLCLKSGKEQQKCGLHNIKKDWVYRLDPDRCIISPLPPHIPKNLKFTICEDLKPNRSRCYKDKCNFAHSPIEIEIWKWMVKNGKTLDDMVNPDVHETYKEPTLQSSGPVLLPADVKLRNYYCEDCSIQFDNLKDINKHTETSDHKFNVEADIVQQWNFRQPPWNKDIKVYQLCSKTDCPYSHVSDQFNYCQDAHGQPELNEWNERYTHRQMKRNMLKDIQFMSYADRVLCKERNGISISCDKDLNVRLTKKKHIWKFTVKINPELPVKRICLLLNRDRHNFNISTSTEHLQFIDGTKLDQSNSNPFTINVHFRSFRDGYFVQWVVFEFGSGPAIVRKLTVETCEEEHNIANEPKCEAEVWTKYTREIITDPSLVEDEFTGKLLTEYKQADEEDRLHAFYNRDFPLNRYNYQHKMHKLLYSEELTRRNIIARYNLVTKVTVTGVIEDETFIFAQSGELFARISLTEDLSEDTDEGRLATPNHG